MKDNRRGEGEKDEGGEGKKRKERKGKGGKRKRIIDGRINHIDNRYSSSVKTYHRRRAEVKWLFFVPRSADLT